MSSETPNFNEHTAGERTDSDKVSSSDELFAAKKRVFEAEWARDKAKEMLVSAEVDLKVAQQRLKSILPNDDAQ